MTTQIFHRWQDIYSTRDTATKRMRVPGGWIYDTASRIVIEGRSIWESPWAVTAVFVALGSDVDEEEAERQAWILEHPQPPPSPNRPRWASGGYAKGPEPPKPTPAPPPQPSRPPPPKAKPKRKTGAKAKRKPAASPFLTVEELARRWECSQRTIRRMIQRGSIKHARIGKQIRIHMNEVNHLEATKEPLLDPDT